MFYISIRWRKFDLEQRFSFLVQPYVESGYFLNICLCAGEPQFGEGQRLGQGVPSILQSNSTRVRAWSGL